MSIACTTVSYAAASARPPAAERSQWSGFQAVIHATPCAVSASSWRSSDRPLPAWTLATRLVGGGVDLPLAVAEAVAADPPLPPGQHRAARVALDADVRREGPRGQRFEADEPPTRVEDRRSRLTGTRVGRKKYVTLRECGRAVRAHADARRRQVRPGDEMLDLRVCAAGHAGLEQLRKAVDRADRKRERERDARRRAADRHELPRAVGPCADEARAVALRVGREATSVHAGFAAADAHPGERRDRRAEQAHLRRRCRVRGAGRGADGERGAGQPRRGAQR